MSCQFLHRHHSVRACVSREPTHEDVEWLLYTEAVIYEALRLYPTFPVITRECTAVAQVSDARTPCI